MAVYLSREVLVSGRNSNSIRSRLFIAPAPAVFRRDRVVPPGDATAARATGARRSSSSLRLSGRCSPSRRRVDPHESGVQPRCLRGPAARPRGGASTTSAFAAQARRYLSSSRDDEVEVEGKKRQDQDGSLPGVQPDETPPARWRDASWSWLYGKAEADHAPSGGDVEGAAADVRYGSNKNTGSEEVVTRPLLSTSSANRSLLPDGSKNANLGSAGGTSHDNGGAGFTGPPKPEPNLDEPPRTTSSSTEEAPRYSRVVHEQLHGLQERARTFPRLAAAICASISVSVFSYCYYRWGLIVDTVADTTNDFVSSTVQHVAASPEIKDSTALFSKEVLLSLFRDEAVRRAVGVWLVELLDESKQPLAANVVGLLKEDIVLEQLSVLGVKWIQILVTKEDVKASLTQLVIHVLQSQAVVAKVVDLVVNDVVKNDGVKTATGELLYDIVTTKEAVEKVASLGERAVRDEALRQAVVAMLNETLRNNDVQKSGRTALWQIVLPSWLAAGGEGAGKKDEVGVGVREGGGVGAPAPSGARAAAGGAASSPENNATSSVSSRSGPTSFAEILESTAAHWEGLSEADRATIAAQSAKLLRLVAREEREESEEKTAPTAFGGVRVVSVAAGAGALGDGAGRDGEDPHPRGRRSSEDEDQEVEEERRAVLVEKQEDGPGSRPSTNRTSSSAREEDVVENKQAKEARTNKPRFIPDIVPAKPRESSGRGGSSAGTTSRTRGTEAAEPDSSTEPGQALKAISSTGSSSSSTIEQFQWQQVAVDPAVVLATGGELFPPNGEIVTTGSSPPGARAPPVASPPPVPAADGGPAAPAESKDPPARRQGQAPAVAAKSYKKIASDKEGTKEQAETGPQKETQRQAQEVALVSMASTNVFPSSQEEEELEMKRRASIQKLSDDDSPSEHVQDQTASDVDQK